MKINFSVIKPEHKPDLHSFDSPSLDAGLIELAKKLKASIATEKKVHNPDGTIGLKSTLFFGNDVKDQVKIIIRFE